MTASDSHAPKPRRPGPKSRARAPQSSDAAAAKPIEPASAAPSSQRRKTATPTPAPTPTPTPTPTTPVALDLEAIKTRLLRAGHARPKPNAPPQPRAFSPEAQRAREDLREHIIADVWALIDAVEASGAQRSRARESVRPSAQASAPSADARSARAASAKTRIELPSSAHRRTNKRRRKP